MRAMMLDEDGRYRLADRPVPSPGPGQVAIRVATAGVQWGDVMVHQGHFPVPRPFVAGFEAAGHIAAVGDGVDASRVGEAVVALTQGGAFAEVVIAPAALAIGCGALAMRTAGGFGWIAPTAFALIHEVARVQAGEAVVIHAATGGVGTLATQLARRAGASRIVGVVRSPEQVDYAARFGATEVITSEQFPDALGDARFDAILDPIGGATRAASLQRLAPHGRLVAYGNLATFAPVTVSANDLLMQGQSLLSYNSNLLSSTHPARLAATARAALAIIAAGELAIDISEESPLEQVGDVIARLAAGQIRGKAIIRIAA